MVNLPREIEYPLYICIQDPKHPSDHHYLRLRQNLADGVQMVIRSDSFCSVFFSLFHVRFYGAIIHVFLSRTSACAFPTDSLSRAFLLLWPSYQID